MLLTLAEFAHDDGSKAYPSIATIAERARLSPRQVQRCLRLLQESGAVAQTGTSPKGTAVYRVAMVDKTSPPDNTSGVTSAAPGDVENVTRSTQDLPVLLSSSSAGAREPREVASKPVTDAERELSLRVLAAFNEAFGKKFSGVSYLRGIIGRLREHPELTAEDHEALIAKAKRSPWWKGDPSPSVIYGNDAVFESVLNQADRPAAADFSEYTKA